MWSAMGRQVESCCSGDLDFAHSQGPPHRAVSVRLHRTTVRDRLCLHSRLHHSLVPDSSTSCIHSRSHLSASWCHWDHPEWYRQPHPLQWFCPSPHPICPRHLNSEQCARGIHILACFPCSTPFFRSHRSGRRNLDLACTFSLYQEQRLPWHTPCPSPVRKQHPQPCVGYDTKLY